MDIWGNIYLGKRAESANEDHLIAIQATFHVRHPEAETYRNEDFIIAFSSLQADVEHEVKNHLEEMFKTLSESCVSEEE